ncbi:MAG TPA: MFS transporter [Thermomicrobiales bacterium]|nr:MFS transporter [Thermomicrobiales bacterium]
MGLGADRARNPRAILPVLIFATMVMSVISTLGTPMVPTIAREQGVSLEAAQWVLTVTLLVGAVFTPVAGRLADGPRRKQVVLATLGAVTLGSVLSASTAQFPLFISGRALQGFGMALVPLAIAVARDTLPRDQVRTGIAILSITTAAGTGLGYPLTGVMAALFDYHAGFWFAAGISLVALALIWAVVPGGSPHPSRPLDLPGAVLLSAALVCLLLAISQGRTWGWESTPILLLFAGAVVFTGLWIVHGLRVAHPLVELRLAVHPAVLVANATAFLMGIGLFATSSLVNRFVQAPAEAGYGFHTGLIATGLVLMPLSVGSMASNWLSRVITSHFGSFAVLPIGALIVAADSFFLAVSRSSLWEIVLAIAILGLGISTTFAAIPALIVRAVPGHETGSAMSLNSVLRSVGGAIGSAASIALLSAYTPAGGHLPTNHGYTVAFLAGSVACVAAAVACLLLRPRAPRDVPVERAGALRPAAAES